MSAEGRVDRTRDRTRASRDYQKRICLGATAETAFDALTDVTAIAGWWTAWDRVTGSAGEGGDVRFFFTTGPAQLVVHVETALRPSSVVWSVPSCACLPDWVDTRPTFTLLPDGLGGCELRFRHHGLTPRLDCFDQCHRGWDQYLASLQDYVEKDRGRD